MDGVPGEQPDETFANSISSIGTPGVAAGEATATVNISDSDGEKTTVKRVIFTRVKNFTDKPVGSRPTFLNTSTKLIAPFRLW